MSRNINRSCYFDKYCRPAPDVTSYMKALAQSPYRTHRRMFELLLPELDKLMLGESVDTEDRTTSRD